MFMHSYGIINYSYNQSFLSTSGKWIVDGDGNIVILRGANYFGYASGVWQYGAPPDHQEEDYDQMKGWGFNVVRLEISWEYIEPLPGVYDESYFANHVDKDIAWAKTRGIYIILDMQQDGYSPYFKGVGSPIQGHGIGFPEWTCNGYPKSNAGLQQAIDDFWLGKAPNGIFPSEDNPSVQDRYIRMWKFVAARYTNEKAVAGYDLMNEPFYGNTHNDGNSLLSLQQTIQIKNDFFRELMDEIMTIDPHHLFLNEPVGADWTVPFEATVGTILDRPNVVYSVHFYDLGKDYDGNFSTLENQWLKRIWEPTKNWNIPIWVGEFNTYESVINRDAWVRDTQTLFDKYRVGAAWESYFRYAPYQAALTNPDQSERFPVPYLDRPFTQKSSIQIESYYFGLTETDQTKIFRLKTEVGIGSQTILIYLPSRYYSDYNISANIPVNSTFNTRSQLLTLEFTLNEQALDLTLIPQ
jgi:aryl-phospho-beta-D-glucosidase BglC (GH1 family)